MNPSSTIPEETPVITCQNKMIEAIHQADRDAANIIIGEWAADYGHEHFFTAVMEPVLRKLGDEWFSRESVTIAQVYVAARIAEDVLNKIACQIKNASETGTTKGPVVFGNIEDDFHSLGRKMVVTFLKINGWEVIDLGNDVTPAEFVDTAVKTGARVIGVSAMTMTTARNIRHLRDEIDSRGLKGKIQLAVGGAVFLVCPSLVAEVGGDGTATNAINAVPMIDRLWNQAVMESHVS